MKPTTVTTVTAVVSLATALFGIFFTVFKFRDERRRRQSDLEEQRERWSKAFEAERKEWVVQHKSELRSEFLHKLVEQRYSTYPPVLQVLGRVRDVPDPSQQHYKSLEVKPEQLLPTADDILEHLYGAAGLVMSMDTRNQLISAWYACHLVQAGEVEVPHVVREFYLARRSLRADLQIDDSTPPITVAAIEKELSS